MECQNLNPNPGMLWIHPCSRSLKYFVAALDSDSSDDSSHYLAVAGACTPIMKAHIINIHAGPNSRLKIELLAPYTNIWSKDKSTTDLEHSSIR